MKIPSKVEEALNEQIQHELGAFYLYWSMACWFETTPFHGFAHWMRKQAKEEMEHAERIHDYILSRGGRVILHPLAKPTGEFQSPTDVIDAALKHEQKITQLIHHLYQLAIEHRDHETTVFLQWFLNEQIEEEKTAGDILEKLQLIDGNHNGLMMMDAELGKR